KCEWYPERGGGFGAGHFALGLHHPRKSRRCNCDREAARATQDASRGVHRGNVTQNRRVELNIFESLTRARDRQLSLGGAIGVVERPRRRASLRYVAKVIDGER